MKQMRLRNLAIASTFACAALLSFHWSEQGGVSLSIAGAQAQDGRAGHARGHGHRYGAGPYRYDAAGIAGPMAVNYAGLAGAAGTPVAAGPGYGGTGPYGGIETKPFYLQRAYPANGPWYVANGWAGYKALGGIVCDPGTMVKGDDGLMHVCQ